MNKTIKELKTFFILWSTQSLSQLGSAMTSFALTLWLYEKTGSALQTALLTICSYTPYVLMSIFAGALSDRWDKKTTMLVCDSLAALTTVAVLVLLKAELLRPWHLYALNAVNGLMNTVQSPASDVAMTLVIPKAHYQRTAGLRAFGNSLVTILNPILATALFALAGMDAVIAVDLGTFLIAALTLLFVIRLPKNEAMARTAREPFSASVREGLTWLRKNRLILLLILFLSGVNFVASSFDAALPALVLSRTGNNETVLGIVSSCAGIATLAGSILATLYPKPKNRIRVICLTLLFSLGTENYLLAFSKNPVLWCIGQILGWFVIPLMNTNLDVINRSTIPVELQGRVFACRNSLQFFTIPLGHFFGGFMVDRVCEPLMAARSSGILTTLFGTGKGSGAALLMLILGVAGTALCLVFSAILRRYHFEEP